MDVTSSADKAIIQAFAKLDKTALGFSVGTVSGLTVFLATILLLVKGGDPLGPNLALLGFLLGFVLGWVTAFLRNFLLNAYLLMVKTRANLNSYFESID